MGHPARLLLGIAIAVLVGHAALLADWVVDDAGISFAYARSLAGGAGLVSQPGAEPVEGFSNPLWTLALAPFFRVGFFHPVWTPKLLSLVLVGLAFFLMARAAPADGVEAWLVASGPLLLALNTSFVVWTMSGLENPLLAFLVALSATLAFALPHDLGPRTAAAGGLVGGLIALTRPEGVAYLGAFACLLMVLGSREGWLRRLATFAFAAGTVVGPYLLFRQIYFRDWLPNTFYAKVRPELVSRDPSRVLELFSSATGRLAPFVVLALAAALLCAWRRRTSRDDACLVLGVYLATAGVVYVALPPDWMGEYRFATPFFLFLFWLTGFGLASLFRSLRSRTSLADVAVPLVTLLLLAEGTRVHAERSLDFARSPTVPFGRIAEFGRAYDALAASLPTPGDASLLLPDLGGTLFTTRHLRLHDLAGLCDRTVARTLMSDTSAFHDYVLERVRPTFIHVHGSWASWAAFHADGRFRRDYEVLHEIWPETVSAEPLSGDYVRRDAIGDGSRLQALRDEFRRRGLDEPLP
jgi:hypothetical protein